MKELTELHTERQKAIIRASAGLFDKVGYHGASMQMIADAVDLGKPTLYHYFRSKSEILFALHQELVSELLDAHEVRAKLTDKADQLLEGLCLDTILFIKNYPGYVRAFFEHFHDLDEEQQSVIRQHRKIYLDMVVGIIEKGIKNRTFTKCNSRTAALGFLGMCTWTYQWLPQNSTEDAVSIASELSSLFLRGIINN